MSEDIELQLAAEGLPRPQRPLRVSARSPYIILTASLALLGLASGGFWAVSGRQHAGMTKAEVAKVTGLSEVPADYCNTAPSLEFAPNSVQYSSLDNMGPDKKHGEGMVFLMKSKIPSAGSAWEKSILMTVNDTNGNYMPFNSQRNGVENGIGMINIMPGHRLELLFHFYDAETGERLTLPEMAFTFYDMDQGTHGETETIVVHDIVSYHTSGLDTEVSVKELDNGNTEFLSTKYGDVRDNPKHALFLTPHQRQRAFTVRFTELRQMAMKFIAGPGTTPRTLLFSGSPTMLCGKEVEAGFVPPLESIVVQRPMQVPIEVDAGEKFGSYRVELDGEVQEGDMVLVTTRADGTEHTYTAPASGKLTQIEPLLNPGDDLDTRLANKVVAAIERPYFQPLDTSEAGVIGGGPGSAQSLDDETYFVKYLKQVGDTVHKNEIICEAKDKNGFIVNILASGSGILQARQEALQEGDPIMQVKDKQLITLSKFPRLPAPGNTYKAGIIHPDLLKLKPYFAGYHVEVGEAIREGDVICVVKDENDDVHEILASHGGMVAAMQDLVVGDPINRVEDDNLCTVGKFAPLTVEAGQRAVEFQGHHSEFIQFMVKEGDSVEEGAEIAVLATEAGVRETIKAPRKGVIVREQAGLKEGMFVNKVMSDKVIAVLGQYPGLPVARTQQGVLAPESGHWRLMEWKARPGDEVRINDPIATIQDSDSGTIKVVRAPKAGRIAGIHPTLHRGDVVNEVAGDRRIAVIGRYHEVEVGYSEVGVQVPSLDVIFQEWVVTPGSTVKKGDFVAKVSRPAPVMEPTNGRRLAVESLMIAAPDSGVIHFVEGHLVQNTKVGQSQDGKTIAKIKLGWPWWYYFLVGIAVLGVVLALVMCILVKSGGASYLRVEDSEARVCSTPRDGRGTTPRGARAKSTK